MWSAFAETNGVFGRDVAQPLTLVVALTMLATPLLFILYERLYARESSTATDRPADPIAEQGTAIVARGGRFGIVVSRILSTNGFQVVVLGHDPDLIETLRKIGIQTDYGDATRPDLLAVAGIEEARLFVCAIDDRDQQTTLVTHVTTHHPRCRVLARATDRLHVFELERARVAGLAAIMRSDRMMERHDPTDRGWTPPPKDH